ncbi:SRPBCC family protein [Flavitalea flava]
MLALYIIGGIVVLILLMAAVTGTGWTYEKSISVKAPLSRVWEKTNSLKALNSWNPWVGRDPDIRIEFSGTDGTPGAKYSWDSAIKNVGAGIQTILSVTDRSELVSRVDFIRPFKGTGQAYIQVREETGATRVTWKIVSSTPYPMNIIKLFGVIEKNMEKDFGEGLNKLKNICER